MKGPALNKLMTSRQLRRSLKRSRDGLLRIQLPPRLGNAFNTVRAPITGLLPIADPPEIKTPPHL
ncbi:hypothetical protein [Usitatibacter rugosus]|uniref:hypothetical protein n=1 Tax=Usitatibacter rugosus TaxID=2732067 RepID=UPI001489B719|nr:hypothetical protein [Usitatibacter rugosus]